MKALVGATSSRLWNLRGPSFPALIQMQPHHYSFIAWVLCSLHLGPLTISRWTFHGQGEKLHNLGWSIQTQLEAQFEASMQTMKCSMPTFLCSGPNEKWGWKQEREKSSHMTPDQRSKAPCPHTVCPQTLMLLACFTLLYTHCKVSVFVVKHIR